MSCMQVSSTASKLCTTAEEVSANILYRIWCTKRLFRKAVIWRGSCQVCQTLRAHAPEPHPQNNGGCNRLLSRREARKKKVHTDPARHNKILLWYP